MVLGRAFLSLLLSSLLLTSFYLYLQHSSDSERGVGVPEAWRHGEDAWIIGAHGGSAILAPADSLPAAHLSANLGATLVHTHLYTGNETLVVGQGDIGDGLEAYANKGIASAPLLAWMARMRPLRVALDIQKQEDAPRLLQALNAFMQASQDIDGHFKEVLEDRVAVSSQSHSTLVAVRRLFDHRLATFCSPLESVLLLLSSQHPHLHDLLMLLSPTWRECAVVDVPASIGVHTFASPSFVAYVQALGKRVHIGVANAEEEMERLLELHVDGVVTDRPDVAFSVFASRGLVQEEERQRVYEAMGSYDVPLYNEDVHVSALEYCESFWCPLLFVPPLSLPLAAIVVLFAMCYWTVSLLGFVIKQCSRTADDEEDEEEEEEEKAEKVPAVGKEKKEALRKRK